VPNGVDKNLVRLAVASAAYRRRFGEWPSEAQLDPIVLQDLAYILGTETFEALAARLTLKTSASTLVSVGGRHGYVRYEDLAEDDAGDYDDEAHQWLGANVRSDLDHY